MNALETLLSGAPTAFILAVDDLNARISAAPSFEASLNSLFTQPHPAIIYLIDAAKTYRTVSATELSKALCAHTEVARRAVPKISELVIQSAQEQEDINAKSAVGRLEKLEWKLAVTTESSIAGHVMQPFVTLVLHAVDAKGSKARHVVELSVAEFNKLHSQVRLARDTFVSE